MTPRVLVIDDEPAVRRTLERALAHLGYQAVGAADGDTAYAILAEGGIDAVLLDINMPVMSGPELFIAIARRWPTLQHRVCLMSGDMLDSDRERWPEELRACPTLLKPFDFHTLRSVIAQLLETAERRPLRRNGS